jgi:putative transposase
MPADELPQRKTLRYAGYDYSRRGAYFVTICSHQKGNIFGTVAGEIVTLNRVGEIVRSVWYALPDRFAGLVLDAFVLMPNHLHGLLGFVGEGLAPPASSVGKAAAGRASPAPTAAVTRDGNYSLADVVGAFKSISTIQVNRLLHRKGVALWQRSYYEHIVRKGEDLRKIQRYILENPLLWSSDPENPDHQSR